MINEMRNEISMKYYHIQINVPIRTHTKMNESLTAAVKRVDVGFYWPISKS